MLSEPGTARTLTRGSGHRRSRPSGIRGRGRGRLRRLVWRHLILWHGA
jgi:hypothetical protein